MKAVVQKLLTVFLSVVLVLGNVAVGAQETHAETFAPEVVERLIAQVNVVPEASTAIKEATTYPATFEWADEAVFDTMTDLVVGTVVVNYEDASEELLEVDIKVVEEITDAELNDPIGTTELIVVNQGEIPEASQYIVNNMVLPPDTIYEWADPSIFDTVGAHQVATIQIIYPDGTFDEMPLLVTVEAIDNGEETEAELHTPVAIDHLITDLNSVPTPSDALANLNELPANIVVTWQDERIFSEVKTEIFENLIVTYADGSSDMLPVLITVTEPTTEETEAELHTPVAIDHLITDLNSVPTPSDALANLNELPANIVVTWQDEQVFNEVKIDINENLIVTYADGSSDMLPVLVTVREPVAEETDAERYTPTAQKLTTERGVIPLAIDAIANLDELPLETQFAWKDDSVFNQLGEAVTTIVLVTYPDKTVDELEVILTVVEDLTPEPDASLYTPRAVKLVTTKKGVVPTAKAAIENINELPNDAQYAWEDESIFNTVVATSTANVVITYADQSTDAVAVPITVTAEVVATHARVIVHFVDTTGHRLLPSQINAREIGTTYAATRVTIEGYTLDSIVGQEKGMVDKDETKNTVTYIYRKLTTQPQLPNTGESSNLFIYGVGALALLVGVASLIIAYRKRRGN